MSCKADSIESLAIEEKEDEGGKDIHLQNDSSPPQRLHETNHWLEQVIKHMKKQYKMYLSITVVIVLLGLVVNASWVAPLMATHDRRLSDLEEKDKLTGTTESLQQTSTARLEELVQEMQANIAAQENKLQTVEEKLNMTLRHNEEILERLQEKEELLEQVLTRAESFERDHNTTIDRVSTLESSHEQLVTDLKLLKIELNSSTIALEGRLDSAEENITLAAKETALLQLQFNSLRGDIAALNTTSASNQLEKRINTLERNSATTSDLNNLKKKVDDQVALSNRRFELYSNMINTNQINIRENSNSITSLQNEVNAGAVASGSWVLVTASIALSFTMTITLNIR